MNQHGNFYALPEAVQQQVARDWVYRKQRDVMRGEGIATHYKFLLWVSAEYDIPMEDLLS